MVEFLTLNQAASQVDYNNALSILTPFCAPLFALIISLVLDKFGAPDDRLNFDPRYDKW